MTAKQFFKSTAFKCIAVLTSILLLSGVILAICWGFMEVTQDEKDKRNIAKVYPGETVTAVKQSLDGMNKAYGATKINRCWTVIEKDDVIVEAKSKGYNGGITCWVTISVNEDIKEDTALDGLTVKGITKVQIYKADAPDELTGNIKDYVYDKFITDYAPGVKYDYGNKENSEQYIYTGASHTLSAVCNCVNASIDFISGKEDPYAAYSYRELINIDSSAWTVDGTTVTYTIVTTANGKPGPFTIQIKTDGTKIADDGFTITVNGSTAQKYIDKMSAEAKNLAGKTLDEIKGYLADTTSGGALVTGATKSNELCLHAAAFALANYQACLNSPKGGN